MRTIPPTLIAARYPLCLADDTLMNDDELIRYIRMRCGDEVADIVQEEIYETSIRVSVLDAISALSDAVSDLEAAEHEISESADAIRKLVNCDV